MSLKTMNLQSCKWLHAIYSQLGFCLIPNIGIWSWSIWKEESFLNTWLVKADCPRAKPEAIFSKLCTELTIAIGILFGMLKEKENHAHQSIETLSI